MKNNYLKPLLTIALFLGSAAFLFFCIHSVRAATPDLTGAFSILEPKGTVALQERDLIGTAAWLMAIIVIPVLFLTFFFAWKYRASNTKAKYEPDWSHNFVDEFIWWALPCIIIFALSIITWQSSHQLDPYKPLNTGAKPLTIQVVSLNWKWLFIYPEQNIATVNFIQFPERVPVNFVLSADSPMNSFWIPELGGQIYSMTGMSTQLHLMADGPGTYAGMSSNFSGTGFSGMKFVAQSSSQTDFDAWVETVKQSPSVLDMETYNKLVKPSENNPVAYYSSVEKDLYNTIVMKYMAPMEHSSSIIPDMHMNMGGSMN